MPDTALLVIDVQQSFQQRDYWTEENTATWQNRQSSLVDATRRHGWPVVFVYHNESSGVFAPENGFVKAIDFVDRRPEDPVFNKHVHNSLTDSGLQEWLQENGIERLLISGIRTEQCCETTARVASDLGYTVEFVLDATLTFEMQHPLTGNSVSADVIMSHTALVLADRFARITRVADYGG